MTARTPRADRDRAAALNARLDAGEGGEGGEGEAQEMWGLIWPAYFADTQRTLPLPSPRFSMDAAAGLSAELDKDTETVAAQLAEHCVPHTVVAGAGSPMPWGQAAQAIVDLSPHGKLDLVLSAGHFTWFEAPGCVRRAMRRLADQTAPD